MRKSPETPRIRRALAGAVDSALLAAKMGVLLLWRARSASRVDGDMQYRTWPLKTVALAYETLIEHGSSPGFRLARLQTVTTANGEQSSWRSALARVLIAHAPGLLTAPLFADRYARQRPSARAKLRAQEGSAPGASGRDMSVGWTLTEQLAVTLALRHLLAPLRRRLNAHVRVRPR